jgi:hypothetical protein
MSGRSPQDFIPLAKSIVASAERRTRGASEIEHYFDVVGLEDRADEASTSEPGWSTVALPVVAAQALRLALDQAMEANRMAFCTHLEDGRRAIVDLSLCQMTCGCDLEVEPELVDDHCDVCGGRASELRSILLVTLDRDYLASACPACTVWIEQVGVDGCEQQWTGC